MNNKRPLNTIIFCLYEAKCEYWNTNDVQCMVNVFSTSDEIFQYIWCFAVFRDIQRICNLYLNTKTYIFSSHLNELSFFPHINAYMRKVYVVSACAEANSQLSVWNVSKCFRQTYGYSLSICFHNAKKHSNVDNVSQCSNCGTTFSAFCFGIINEQLLLFSASGISV